MTSPNSSSTQRVYYPTNRTLFLILGTASLVVVGYMLLDLINRVGSGGTPVQPGDFSVLIPLAIGLLNLALALSGKIIVTPNHLHFHQFGFQAHTSWSNLTQIGPPPRGPQSVMVLHLRQPAVMDWVWHPAGYKEQLRVFPLIGYIYAPGSPLRADLEHYAPQLFR
jgi:hypothetical protein